MVCKMHVHQREGLFISKQHENGHLNTVHIFIKNTDKTDRLNYWNNIYFLCAHEHRFDFIHIDPS